jgi:hypothetical protein
MSTQGYTPTKDTTLEVATEIPPVLPTTWAYAPMSQDIYDLQGMPLVRQMKDTTTVGVSRYRDHTKLLYDPIEITFSAWYLNSQYQLLAAIQDEEPGERWWKLVFGDGSNFVFCGTVSGLSVISGPIDDVVRADGALTVSGDVTFSDVP